MVPSLFIEVPVVSKISNWSCTALNQFLKEGRNKIICKLYKEETIFISAFNAENFMKIR
jgi:hypothetical protein